MSSTIVWYPLMETMFLVILSNGIVNLDPDKPKE